MDSGKILGAMSQMLAEQENETRKLIEERELTIKMQKGIIADLEKRIGEEKRLCAEWRKRALLAEKEEEKRAAEDAVSYGENLNTAQPVDDVCPYDFDIADVLQKAINTFGARAQKLKCVEELLELGLALVRDQLGRSDRENIAEEHADVSIMLRQLYMIQEDEVNVRAWKLEKLRRLKQTLDNMKIKEATPA